MDIEQIERALRQAPPDEPVYRGGRWSAARPQPPRIRPLIVPGRLGIGLLAVCFVAILLIARPEGIVAPGASPTASPSVSPAPSPGLFPMYKGGPGRTGESGQLGPIAGSTIRWSIPIGLGVRSSPALAGGVAYLVGGADQLAALDLATGATRWEVGSSFAGSPAVDLERIYVLGSDFSISALSRTDGRRLWTTAATLHPDSAPLVVGGTVIAAGSAGIEAFDSATGRRLWTAPTAGSVVRAVASDGRLVFGGGGGRLDAIDVATGRRVWSATVATGDLATPAVRNGIVVQVGETGGRAAVVAFDTQTGDVRWRYMSPDDATFGTPGMDGDHVYVASSRGGIVALEVSDGRPDWIASTDPIGEAALGVTLNGVYGFTSGQSLVGVDPTSGSVVLSVQLDGGVEIGTASSDGVIVAATSFGQVVAIGGATDK